MTDRPDAAEKRLLVTFRLDGDRYALDIHRVREVVECGDVTRVPRAPAAVRGVISLRGGVVPVVDLAVKFGLPPTRLAKRTCVVVVELSEGEEAAVVGILADEVDRVLELPAADVEPAPRFGTRVHVDYLIGLAKVGEEFVLILDIARLLSVDELCGEPATALDGALPNAT
jgi:purine-binding chemotaxis protein CheW